MILVLRRTLVLHRLVQQMTVAVHREHVLKLYFVHTVPETLV